MRRLVLPLLLALALAGCTRDDPPPAQAEANVTAGPGLVAERGNGSVAVRLADAVQVQVAQACAGPCRPIQVPTGTVVADAGFVSLGNASLNAAGPDGDSALFFYDGGLETGRFLRWSEVQSRFQMNADLLVTGNVTATGHVGTTTPLVLPNGQVVTLSTAALEGTEQAVFFRGSGVLMNGTYQFSVPSAFAAIADLEGHVTAQATLTADGPGVYVSRKGPDRFEFRALGGADVSDVTFDYFIQAPRVRATPFEV